LLQKKEQKGEIFIEKGGKTNARTLPLQANQILLFYNYLEARKTLLEHTKKQTDYFITSKYGTALNPHGISRLINDKKPKEEHVQPLKIRQSVIANLLKSNKFCTIFKKLSTKNLQKKNKMIIINNQSLKRKIFGFITSIHRHNSDSNSNLKDWY
jgi:site-specific recombinase XerC